MGGVTAWAGDEPTLNIAYQYGLAYAPLIICQQEGLIEQAYEELTGEELEVVWNQLSSGADINTGFASGSLDVGFVGIAPAITGIGNHIGYKIFTNISGQEHGLMTCADDLESLEDLVGSDQQIALVNTGSIQHIILGMALAESGLDAHALDSNIVAMKHPDGMSALLSGSIACHLTTNPYIYKEREDDSFHELIEVSDVWSADRSFIVGVASESLESENPELFEALQSAVSDAIDFIHDDTEAAAEITCEFDGSTKEEELQYLQAGSYSTETQGVLELAQFMADNGFSEAEFEAFAELVFDCVTGD